MAKRGGNTNSTLNSAKSAKNDEFYTQLPDIEREVFRYANQLRGKVIFCNCDDPYESEFFKYFAMQFNHLGLKKLIATCYIGSPIANTQVSLFDHEPVEDKTTKSPHKIEIVEVDDYNADGAVDLADVEYLLRNRKNVLTRLKGDGDFRSLECIELLKQADVVVTNPPFSLFREYVAQLDEYKKKYLILGNKNAITYKEIFKLIKDDRLRTGYMNMGYDIHFIVPPHCEVYSEIRDGVKYARSPSIWFTSLDVSKHNEKLTLYKTYNVKEYPKYDNYDAIDVSKVAEIPQDYDGCMGVPITFLDKHNPKQFEIVKFRKGIDDKDLSINGKCPYFRVIIRKKK